MDGSSVPDSRRFIKMPPRSKKAAVVPALGKPLKRKFFAR
jgi:hypothetical protein